MVLLFGILVLGGRNSERSDHEPVSTWKPKTQWYSTTDALETSDRQEISRNRTARLAQLIVSFERHFGRVDGQLECPRNMSLWHSAEATCGDPGGSRL